MAARAIARIFRNTLAFVLSPGSHYSMPAGTGLVEVDSEYGHLLAGKNLCLAPEPRQNESRTVADFLWDQVMQRLVTRSVSCTQIDDAADFTGVRFGPVGGYPYAAASNGDGTYASLTGIDSNISVCQVRSKPGAVPYNGDLTTVGGIAEATSATMNMKTTERPRYLLSQSGTTDLAVGTLVEFGVTPNGYNGRQELSALRIYSNGNILVGRSATVAGDNGAHLQLRGDAGQSETFVVAKSGTVSGGTFTLTWYGAPPSSPSFASAVATTAAIAYDATAATVASALETAIAGAGTAVSNLTGTVATTNGNATITGTTTAFSTELREGDYITVDSVQYNVTGVSSDTAITVSPTPSATASGLTATRRNVAGTGGPLPNSAVTLNFCGALRHAHYVRCTVTSSLTGGGTVTCTYGTYGFASGLGQILLRARHGGKAGSTPTAGYYQWENTSGTAVQSLGATGTFTNAGQVTIGGALDHDGSTVGFYGVTPAARASAYTQTYSTADKTHANPTASTLTVSDGAGTNDNTIGAITADPSVIAAVQELADEINKLVADLADTKQLLNSVIDDLQAVGLVQ